MSTYDVLKPFNTVNRRLVVGATISETDELAPFTIEERKEHGFIKMNGDDAPSIEVASPPKVAPRARTDKPADDE